jgi:hypothetical protein
MYLNETGFENVDWIYVPQDIGLWWALTNTVMDIWVP